MQILPVNEALPLIQQGGIVAYPTEAVYGLGCDPFNCAAVEALCELKGREIGKGLILIIDNWSQLFSLTAPITDEQLARVKATWPGFTTWIFPKALSLPSWITGDHDSIAIRMSQHPIARALATDNPIISTSANLSGYPPATTGEQVVEQFPNGIDAIVTGALGSELKPSPIYDILSGQQLR